MGIEAEITPKGASNLGQSLSQPCGCQLPLHKGALPCGGRGDGTGMRIAVTSVPNFGAKFGWRWLRPRRVGPAGLLAMTMVFCHSEERSDVGIRPFTMDGGRAAEVVGPYGRSIKVPATGRCRHRPLRKGEEAATTTQASRRAAKRPRPRPRGMGGNRRKNHPKKGTAAATAQAALSEAESAERAAGQIQSLPDDLRVQHGVRGSEVSAKLRPCSR